MNKLYLGGCLEVMNKIEDHSIDMILCDLPYGTTACKWDSIIPLKPLWKHYKRIIKSNGAIVLTASQPFTSKLVASNPNMFKYEWIWRKTKPGGAFDAKNKPMKEHEEILIFSFGSIPTNSKNKMIYNPQGLIDCNKTVKNTKTFRASYGGNRPGLKEEYIQTKTNYPKTILEIPSETKTIHPTQKPISLFEYLIKTYTNEGELVLDNCAGSGTAAIACINTNRKYILIEKDPEYYQIAKDRIAAHTKL